MKHIRDNLVPTSVFTLAVISFRLARISGGYLAVEVHTRFARNVLFTLALILPVTCDMGINFAIVAGVTSAQMAMVFSVNLRPEGAMILMFVTGANIVLSILSGMMVAALLNKAKRREMTVSTMIGQLNSVIYQLIFMVTYGLLIRSGNRDILPDRGIGTRGMVNTRSMGSVFKRILPLRSDRKTYSFFPLVIILFFSLVLLCIQETWLGTLVGTVGADRGTAGTLRIVGNRMCSVHIVISAIFMAMSQILFVADSRTINIYIGHLGLDTLAAAAILVGGASIKKARIGNCFIGAILSHALFITLPMARQGLFHNPSVGEYLRSFLVYGVIVTAIIMNLRNGRTKVQNIWCGAGVIYLHA